MYFSNLGVKGLITCAFLSPLFHKWLEFAGGRTLGQKKKKIGNKVNDNKNTSKPHKLRT